MRRAAAIDGTVPAASARQHSLEEMRVRLLIDKDLLSAPSFGAHPLMNTSTVAFKTSDLTEKVIPALHHEPTYVKLIGE
jgi:Ala-tRNA(Pro) deacylase